ncbi:uncharacterized protein L199_003582 [Kwoniella botswanensis]|uniref:uncharacterized protein n=1 Tax=Kwoniella botswanensis TaxID=1268659 RepID=UPI00315CC4CC
MSNQQGHPGYPGYLHSDHTYQEGDPYGNEGYSQQQVAQDMADAERYAHPPHSPLMSTSRLQRNGMSTYPPSMPETQEGETPSEATHAYSGTTGVNDESALRRMLGMTPVQQAPTGTGTDAGVTQYEAFQPSPPARSFTAPSTCSSMDPPATKAESTEGTHEQPAGGDDKMDEHFPSLQRAHTSTSQNSIGGTSRFPGSGRKRGGKRKYESLDWKS